MGVLNEERLALYDSLIKKYCLNHNDLLTKIYSIIYFKGEWCCDDASFFDNNDNKVVIAYFFGEISSYDFGQITVWYKEDYCQSYDRWPEPGDDYYNEKRQVCIDYYNYIPKGYTFLFSVGSSNNYHALSYPAAVEMPEIPELPGYVKNLEYIPFISLYQGYNIFGEKSFAQCNDISFFREKQVRFFVAECSTPIYTSGYIAYPDDNCGSGFNWEWDSIQCKIYNNIIPKGYSLFVKTDDGFVMSSGASLPSASEGQFMVYTNGSWQGKTITVGGSY